MNTITETLANGRTVTYKIVNGTAYHEETPQAVIDVLESARESRQRITLHYGYSGFSKTSRGYGESESGYIGRSAGSIKIPLILHNSRSDGGSAISDNFIVRIETSRGKVQLY